MGYRNRNCTKSQKAHVLIRAPIFWHARQSNGFPRFRRFALAPPICIIKDGVKQDAALRRELISDDDGTGGPRRGL